MKTHENRALFSKAVLKVTTCLFLTAGVGISPVFAFTEMVGTNDIAIVQQQTVTITGVIKDKRFIRRMRSFSHALLVF